METLATERMLLEPWNERHRGTWRSICRDPDVMRFIGLGRAWESAKADEVFDRALGHWQEHGFGWRSALDSATDAWLGFVGLNYVGPGIEGVPPDQVEIGWWIVRVAWGSGYASEGALAARDEGFEPIGLEQIIARIQTANVASARVAQKIGMSVDRATTGRSGEALHIYLLDRAGWKRQRASLPTRSDRRRNPQGLSPRPAQGTVPCGFSGTVPR